MGKTPQMIRFFGEKTGQPYPYVKYAQVCVPDFIAGGMENITATTMTESALHDEIAELEGDADGLVAHELAHQWFGDLLVGLQGGAPRLKARWHFEDADKTIRSRSSRRRRSTTRHRCSDCRRRSKSPRTSARPPPSPRRLPPPPRELAALHSKYGQPESLRSAAIGAFPRLAKDDPALQDILVELVNDADRSVRFRAWMAVASGGKKGPATTASPPRSRERRLQQLYRAASLKRRSTP